MALHRAISGAVAVAAKPAYDGVNCRNGASESRLPPGSVVHFRAPDLLSGLGDGPDRRGRVGGQALLIIGLLLAPSDRRQSASRRTGARADMSRRATMSALTSSIAHELCQPLSAMMHNSEALQMMINNQRATPENIREILTDIHSRHPRRGNHRAPPDDASQPPAAEAVMPGRYQ
jgi:signal transduction histidine kinase